MAAFDDLILRAVVQRLLAPVKLPVGTPSAQPTLASYVPTYSTTYSSESLASALGYSPFLFTNVDQRVQVMPSDVVDRIATVLGRPRGEVVWACGGRELTARAPAIGAPSPG
jgi:hypothetical protein